MRDNLPEIKSTVSIEEKERQLDNLFNLVVRMLVVEGHKVKAVEGEAEMFDIINRLDIDMALNIVAGEHMPCVRPGCHYKTHANFFRASDSKIWLYTCPCCKAGVETISLAELVIELFKYKYPQCNHRTIVRLIRKAFDANFVSEFYVETNNRLQYNLEILRNVDKDSYLGKLIKKRRLEELLEDYSEIAQMYLLEDNAYDFSFYASRKILLEYFRDMKHTSKSNAIVEKVNLLADMGFITKITGDEIPQEMRKKVKVKDDVDFFVKDVSVYQVRRITEEQLQQAEEYAKAVITNKIYRNKVSIQKSIDEACSFTKEEELFLNRANKAIEAELKSKGYIALSTLASKIDKKSKYYKKAEKDALLELLLDRVLLEANVRKIKATETNKAKYNMKRVKAGEVILVRSDKLVEVSPRIRVAESVRVAKKVKSDKIITKKKRKEIFKNNPSATLGELEGLKLVRTWKENGYIYREYDNGEIEEDIPF